MCVSNFRHINASAKCFKSLPGIISARSFFTEKELGVDDLRQHRLKIRSQIEKQNEDINLHKLNLIQSFPHLPLKEKANQLLDFVSLMDSTDNDLEMLKSILVQYQNDIVTAAANDNSNVPNETEFHVGTSIMRTFCLLNFPDAASEVIGNLDFSKFDNTFHPYSFDLQFYKDERMQTLFDDMDVYKLFLTLLHNNKRYAEIFKLYNEIRARVELHNKLPHASINVLAFSACYHLVKCIEIEYWQQQKPNSIYHVWIFFLSEYTRTLQLCERVISTCVFKAW